jgi:Lrp/AsnC family leucine-responsive transcriptional regulator
MTKIDEIDDRILQALSRDGRLSNVELADRVGLSPSACSRRVAELERSGAILGYRAVVAPEARGGGFTTLVSIGLNEHTKDAQLGFERAVARAWQVRECHNITGAVEYILRIEVPDLAAYKEFHTEVLGALPQVRQITTFVVMASPKDERG